MKNTLNDLINASKNVNDDLNKLGQTTCSDFSSAPEEKDNKSISDEEIEKSFKIDLYKLLIIFLTTALTVFLFFTQVIVIKITKSFWIGGGSGLLAVALEKAIEYIISKTKIKQFLENKNIKTRISKTVIIISLVLSTIFSHVEPAYTWAAEQTGNFFESISNVMQTPETEDDNESADTSVLVKDNTVEPTENNNSYNEDMDFIIDNNDLREKINNTVLSNAYLNSEYDSGEYLRELSYLRGSKTPKENNDKLKDIKNKEYIFYNINDLLTEKDLMNIINEQDSYAENYPSYYIYNRLSNNYQKLALEYKKQNSYTSTMKYYYLKSIEYDIKCVEYAETKEQYYTSLNRLYYRYNDIYIFCSNTEEEKEKLLFMLNELDDYKYNS